MFALKSSWVMSCAYSASNNFVASGGLDNICSVFKLGPKDEDVKIFRELSGHTGYLSCCRFIEDKQMVTGSTDTTCILWDIENAVKDVTFEEHVGEVMSLSYLPGSNVFISGACDGMAKLWDKNSGKCVQSFMSHESPAEINAIQFVPNGHSFVIGSDDGTCRLFDIRSDSELMVYAEEKNQISISSVAFSRSARYLFAGCGNNCLVFDTLSGDSLWKFEGHTDRVSCIGVNFDGTALCTGSWDNSLRIWA